MLVDVAADGRSAKAVWRGKSDSEINTDGLHSIMDYNGEWYDFFYNNPVKPTFEGAKALATDLLWRAGLRIKPGDFHWYQSPRRSTPGHLAAASPWDRSVPCPCCPWA